jgi:hypothetical protein
MAICGHCGREMTQEVSCKDDPTVIGGKAYAPLPYGEERYPKRYKPAPNCGDCGTPLGGVHHPGCDLESCPICMGQALTCGHFDDPDDDGYAEWEKTPMRNPRRCTSHLFRQAGGGTHSGR